MFAESFHKFSNIRYHRLNALYSQRWHPLSLRNGTGNGTNPAAQTGN
jgi:hypothetical protein